MVLVNKVYDASKFFPDEEKFGMRSQFTRAGISIPTNIAEGCAKKSEKEYLRYIEISLGSAYELETHLLIVEQRGWLPESMLNELMVMVTEIQKMITKFIDKTA
jgi:four helix bundle protein